MIKIDGKNVNVFSYRHNGRLWISDDNYVPSDYDANVWGEPGHLNAVYYKGVLVWGDPRFATTELEHFSFGSIGDGNTVKLGVDTTVIQTKLTDEQIQNIIDVTTLKTASSTWDNVSAKLNTTDFTTYTATTAPSTYQAKGNYLSSNALEGYATQDWVNQYPRIY